MRFLPSGLLDRWFAPPPHQSRTAWLGRHEYAHRGLHSPGVPENSISAFAAAIARGMGMECDVQKSADGEAMVFHDWELDRLTDDQGEVVARSSGELARITLKGSNDRIPTLRDLLGLIRGRQPLLIEIKSKRTIQPDPLCLAVMRALEGYHGPHAVMSFDPRVVHWFRTHSPNTLRGLVVTEENARSLPWRLYRHWCIWHGRPDFLAYDVRDFPSNFAASQRARGLPVLTWTVRSPELRRIAAEFADAPIAEGAGVATLRT
ncbi:MAG TPA: glycerophosphodiester phosphodiesterase family protein [Sphingomonadaceae bacterium]|nr:glycerophosphodiester phosphodiesterase family protein [Sphingomonadaceae bacterium]